MLVTHASHAQTVKDAFGEFETREQLFDAQGSYNYNAIPTYTSNVGAYRLGFEAVSQYDAASFNRNFIPPDTMGAVGSTQFMAVANGAYGVFDKTTGARLSVVSDTAFWAAAGQTGANGDTRIQYNAVANRWVMVSFGANTKDLQIAVSNTSNALGGWQSVKFEGYAGLGFGATADYPTLAMDNSSIYIGTNNFAPATSGGSSTYRGTTLDVIPLNSVFNAGAPTVTNMKQFITPYVAGSTTNADRGYAIQGVNSTSSSGTGKVVAASAFVDDYVGYTITGATGSSATAAAQGTVVTLGTAAATAPGAARQPAVALPANQRVIDASDGRVSSSSYEANGRIYMVATVQSSLSGNIDEARVRWTVLDSNTFAILAQGDIGTAGYDYYQASIGVNESGKVVIGYNRSGLDAATGKISFMAATFNTALDGSLVPVSGEMLLKESLTDDYHNGANFGLPASGRQRWGDYSQVTVDPTNPDDFYVIGEFAREYNNDAGGHPGGTGGSRWSTWVAMIDTSVTAVPEPSSWLMMLGGAVALGGWMRRRQAAAV